MPPFYSFTFVLTLACAAFFYRAGQAEGESGFTWAALSVVISLGIWLWLHGGFFSVTLGQVGLFVGITVYRSLRES